MLHCVYNSKDGKGDLTMIGIGKWSVSIDTMMFRGDVILTIADENGAYSLTAEVPGMKMPEYNVSDIAEDGDTLTAVVTTPLLSGKKIAALYRILE